MAKVLTNIELDIEALLAHIRAMLEKDPNAQIHINPPPDQTIKVGGPHPASGTPTNHKKP